MVDMYPYGNDELVVYMDDYTGTNVMLQPVRTQGTGKPTVHVSRVPPGPSRLARDRGLPMPLLEADSGSRRNLPTDYGPEIDDMENKRLNGGRDDLEHRPEEGSPSQMYARRRFPFDVNIYQQKKTLAQGMMDLALISANTNQFRYVLQSTSHPYYMASLGMIGTSLVLQIIVGIGLIWNSRYNVKKDNHAYRANTINNLTVIGIFLVTILNVFITSFGVAEPSSIPIKSADDPGDASDELKKE